jgi:thiol:disulfide interchange protein DsbD
MKPLRNPWIGATLGTALAACAFALPAAAAAASAGDDYLDPAQAFRGSASVLDAKALELRIDIAPGYHLYRDRISVEPDDAATTLGTPAIPAGTVQYDETFRKDVEILRDAVPIRVPVPAAKGDFGLRITYQGCADRGLCYAPQTAHVAVASNGSGLVRASWQGEEAGASASASEPAPPPAGRIESALRSGHLPAIVAVFFVAGLLLAFTPCVLPMLPILSSIIVGQQAPVSRRRGLALALAYSLGMALVYTAFGVVAGLLGEGLAAALQNPWVLGAFALLLSALALSMFGVFELQMPGFIQSRLAERSGRLPGGTFAGVFAMGGLSALIVGPCVAAPLAGALVFISQTRDVVIGGLALFCLASGMSVPLLLVGVSAGSLLPRAGRWMQGVKVFFGVLLLLVALWIVAPVLPAQALMALASGAHRDASAGAEASKGDDFRRILTVAELDQALRAPGRPVLLDFRADWCVSCKEMEHLTFSDPAVRARMSRALLLKADVTANSADDKALLKRFGLFGPPGVLLFDASGKEQGSARVIGFMPATQFAASLGAVGL